MVLTGKVPQISLDKSQEYLKILKTLALSCSNRFKSQLLSPYSVIIDHEFLGIPSTIETCLKSLFYFEETLLNWNYSFKISYIILQGSVSQPVIKKTSAQLMGEGITQAREMLNKKKSIHPRVFFCIQPEHLSSQLNKLFLVIDSIVSKWNQRDFSLISDMLKNENNEEVSIKHRKNRSQIWKRRKNLQIIEYKALKEVILSLPP